MADIKKIIEDLNSILEDELIDQFDMESVELENDVKAEIEKPLSLTDELDAKTKISRALDNFKKALEDFKSASISEIDLIKDSNIIDSMECLTKCCSDIESALSGKNDLKNQMELDLVEEPQEVEEEDSVEPIEVEETEEDEKLDAQSEDEKLDDDSDDDFSSFEEEAEFELFN